MKNSNLSRYVIVKLQFEGYHQWSDCPIEDVSFLRNLHRHIFHVTATKEVTHNDRDVEIIMLKRNILSYLSGQPINFGNNSCEDIAEILINKFDLISCEVLEDGENGAILVKR